MSVNKTILMGNIGKDMSFNTTASGMAVLKFSLATQKVNKDKTKKTDWHRIVAFGSTAEIVQKYFNPGDGIYIEGEISYGQYEKDGIVRYTTDIIMKEFTFPPGKGKGSQDNQQQNQQQNPGNNTQSFEQRQQSHQNSYQSGNQQQNNSQSQQDSEFEDYFKHGSNGRKDDDIPF